MRKDDLPQEIQMKKAEEYENGSGDDQDDGPADDFEPCYRDGSLQNECWKSE